MKQLYLRLLAAVAGMVMSFLAYGQAEDDLHARQQYVFGQVAGRLCPIGAYYAPK